MSSLKTEIPEKPEEVVNPDPSDNDLLAKLAAITGERDSHVSEIKKLQMQVSRFQDSLDKTKSEKSDLEKILRGLKNIQSPSSPGKSLHDTLCEFLNLGK
jgi:predicted nuclease with TOPRIM domain